MSDIGDWFRSIPAITRYWFAATVAVPLVGKLGLISPAYFFLWPEAFLYRFQVLTSNEGSGDCRSQEARRRQSVDPHVAGARCLVGFVVRPLQRFRAGPVVWGRGGGEGVWSWGQDGWRNGFGLVGRDWFRPSKIMLPALRMQTRRQWEGNSVIVVNLLDTGD